MASPDHRASFATVLALAVLCASLLAHVNQPHLFTSVSCVHRVTFCHPHLVCVRWRVRVPLHRRRRHVWRYNAVELRDKPHAGALLLGPVFLWAFCPGAPLWLLPFALSVGWLLRTRHSTVAVTAMSLRRLRDADFARLVRLGVEPNPGPPPNKYQCPGCAKTYCVNAPFAAHVSTHEQAGVTITAEFFNQWNAGNAHSIYRCAGCKAIHHGRWRMHCTKCAPALRANRAGLTVSDSDAEDAVVRDPTVAPPEANAQADAAPPPTPSDELPSPDDIIRAHVPMAPRIPLKARTIVAASLGRCLIDATHSPQGYLRLLLFVRTVLADFRGGKNADAAQVVRHRVKHFDTSSTAMLWEELAEAARVSAERRKKPRFTPGKLMPGEQARNDEARYRRARYWLDYGFFARAAAAFSNTQVHALTSEVIQRLHDLHPRGRAVSPIDVATRPTTLFTQDELNAAIRSFSRETAPGPMGLQISVLRDLLDADALGVLSLSLRTFCLACATGKIPAEARPSLFGACLTPLMKKDGGVRPIAVGNILRRLAAKLMLARVRADVTTHFEGVQYGVCCPGGTEHIIHWCRASGPLNGTGSSLLLVDLRNAFNSVDRTLCLQRLAATFPALSGLAMQLYGTESNLYVTVDDELTISSSCGVQQGCPLGPLLFALSIDETIRQVGARHPLVKHKWYLDDGCAVGSTEALIAYLNDLEAELRHVGLSVNRDKCELHVPCADVSLPTAATGAGLKAFPPDAKILGAPVGTEEFTRRSIEDHVQTRCEPLLTRIEDWDDVHAGFVLLRTCAAHCKVTHFMRSCPPSLVAAPLKAFDERVTQVWSRCTGVYLPDAASRLQVSLPSWAGGLGLPRTAELCHGAYFASALTCGALVHSPQQLAEALCGALVATGGAFPNKPTSQKAWSALVHLANRDRLLRHPLVAQSPHRAAHVRAASDASTKWLQSIPSRTLGFAFEPAHFAVAVQFWLGLEFSSGGYKCQCCGKKVDAFGSHASWCSGCGHSIKRHDAIRDLLFDQASAALMGPKREVLLSADSAARPADVLLKLTQSTCATAVDVTVRSPFTVRGLVTDTEAVLLAAEDSKRVKNATMCAAAKVAYRTFAITCCGALAQEADDLVQMMARQIALRGTIRQDEALRQLRVNVARVAMKHTTTAVFDSLPASRQLEPSPMWLCVLTEAFAAFDECLRLHTEPIAAEAARLHLLVLAQAPATSADATLSHNGPDMSAPPSAGDTALPQPVSTVASAQPVQPPHAVTTSAARLSADHAPPPAAPGADASPDTRPAAVDAALSAETPQRAPSARSSTTSASPHAQPETTATEAAGCPTAEASTRASMDAAPQDTSPEAGALRRTAPAADVPPSDEIRFVPQPVPTWPHMMAPRPSTTTTTSQPLAPPRLDKPAPARPRRTKGAGSSLSTTRSQPTLAALRSAATAKPPSPVQVASTPAAVAHGAPATPAVDTHAQAGPAERTSLTASATLAADRCRALEAAAAALLHQHAVGARDLYALFEAFLCQLAPYMRTPVMSTRCPDPGPESFGEPFGEPRPPPVDRLANADGSPYTPARHFSTGAFASFSLPTVASSGVPSEGSRAINSWSAADSQGVVIEDHPRMIDTAPPVSVPSIPAVAAKATPPRMNPPTLTPTAPRLMPVAEPVSAPGDQLPRVPPPTMLNGPKQCTPLTHTATTPSTDEGVRVVAGHAVAQPAERDPSPPPRAPILLSADDRAATVPTSTQPTSVRPSVTRCGVPSVCPTVRAGSSGDSCGAATSIQRAPVNPPPATRLAPSLAPHPTADGPSPQRVHLAHSAPSPPQHGASLPGVDDAAVEPPASAKPAGTRPRPRHDRWRRDGASASAAVPRRPRFKRSSAPKATPIATPHPATRRKMRARNLAASSAVPQPSQGDRENAQAAAPSVAMLAPADIRRRRLHRRGGKADRANIPLVELHRCSAEVTRIITTAPTDTDDIPLVALARDATLACAAAQAPPPSPPTLPPGESTTAPPRASAPNKRLRRRRELGGDVPQRGRAPSKSRSPSAESADHTDGPRPPSPPARPQSVPQSVLPPSKPKNCVPTACPQSVPSDQRAHTNSCPQSVCSDSVLPVRAKKTTSTNISSPPTPPPSALTADPAPAAPVVPVLASFFDSPAADASTSADAAAADSSLSTVAKAPRVVRSHKKSRDCAPTSHLSSLSSATSAPLSSTPSSLGVSPDVPPPTSEPATNQQARRRGRGGDTLPVNATSISCSTEGPSAPPSPNAAAVPALQRPAAASR